MKNFLFFIDSLSLWTGKAFAWLILVLTLGVSYEVFVRYVLSAPTTWAFDFSYITYGALFLMAGAYTLSRNGHVRADVIYRFLPPRTQASFDIVLYVIFFLPAIAAFMYSGYIYAEMSVRFREVSIFSPAGVPVFPLKTLIPITGFLLLLQGIAEIIRCILCIREGAWPARLHDVEETESVIIHETQYKQERGEDDVRSQSRCRGTKGLEHDRSASRHVDAISVHLHHHAGISDCLHPDGDGIGLWFLCLLRARTGNIPESHLHPSGIESLRGDVERRAHRGPAIFVYGIRGRAREHPRPPVSLSATIDEEHSRRTCRGDAGHLRDVCDRHRYRGCRGDAYGAAGFPCHVARRL